MVVTTLTSWNILETQPINRKIRVGNLQVVNKPNVIVNYNKLMEVLTAHTLIQHCTVS